MKRISSIILLIATLLTVFSCKKDDTSLQIAQGEASVTLDLAIPQIAATKAFGAGTHDAKNVIIGVFNSAGSEIEELRTVLEWSAETLSDEVKFKLLKGNSYSIVCWAQYGDTYGDPATMSLTDIVIDYENLKSNEEGRDAFFASVGPFEVEGDFSKSVVLKRPFAQINFATTPGDIEAAKIAGLNTLQTSVVVKNAATHLNLFTGKTSEPKEVRVQRTDFASQTIEVEEETYDLLAMNYILVHDGSADGNSSSTVDLILEVGGVETPVPNAQVKRNYRTNVVGTILTGTGNFKVSVDPAFGGYYDYDENGDPIGSGEEKPEEDPEEDEPQDAPESFVSIPYREAFGTDQGKFTIDNVTLPEGLTSVWNWDAQYGMKASAYSGGKNASESWLISPWIDLTAATSAYLSYDHAAGYFAASVGDEVSVMVKEFGGEWSAATVATWPTDWTFVNSGDIDLAAYAGKYIQVAVKYTSTTESTGTYEIKNFRVGATHTPYLKVASDKVTVEADATSAQFEVESNCTFTATSDNSEFVAAVSGSTVTVTFAANTTSTARSAKITLTGEEGITQVVTVTQKGVPSSGGEYSMIEETASLSAGTYYMSGYLTNYSYTSNGEEKSFDWSANPYHICTGVGSDISTEEYAFTDGSLVASADAEGTPVDVVLEAVTGKDNTYYIKIDGEYLYSSEWSNRKLALGDTPTEWVATDNQNGGITMTTTLSEGTISIGTAGAASKLIRSYKNESTLKYGLVFFKKN